jgi:hypothetical protein
MAKLSLGQKVNRVMRLYMGLRILAVAMALRAHGFSEEELDRGFALLKKLVVGRLGVKPIEAVAKPVAWLDAWENKWFPIVQAVLNTHFPSARDVVFLNLSQTSGPPVVLTVGTLLDRIEVQPEEVRALLATRGLTPEVIADARSQIAVFGDITKEDESTVIDEAADEAAEAELWAWYLEWSTIARTIITNRRYLRALGFLRNSKGEVVEAPLEEDEDGEDGDPSPDPQPAEPSEPVDGGDPPLPPPFTE